MNRFFTPESANKKLPELRKMLVDIAALRKRLNGTTFGSVNERRSILDSIAVNSSKISELGIELKDLDAGLVDFPAMRFDEPVYLCWKLGEPEVLYWHEMHEGFRGRKLLRPEAAQVR